MCNKIALGLWLLGAPALAEPISLGYLDNNPAQFTYSLGRECTGERLISYENFQKDTRELTGWNTLVAKQQKILEALDRTDRDLARGSDGSRAKKSALNQQLLNNRAEREVLQPVIRFAADLSVLLEIERCVVFEIENTDERKQNLYSKVLLTYAKDLDSDSVDLIAAHKDTHLLNSIEDDLTSVNSFYLKATRPSGNMIKYFSGYGTIVFQQGKMLTAKKEIDFTKPICAISLYRYDRNTSNAAYPHSWKHLKARIAPISFKSMKFIQSSSSHHDPEGAYFVHLIAQQRLPKSGLVYNLGDEKNLVFPQMRCGYPREFGTVSSIPVLSYACDDHFLSAKKVARDKKIVPKQKMNFEMLRSVLPRSIEIKTSETTEVERLQE